MATNHYLAFRSLVGESLKYGAGLDGNSVVTHEASMVGLLTAATPLLHHVGHLAPVQLAPVPSPTGAGRAQQI